MWVDRWFGGGFAAAVYFQSMSQDIVVMFHPNLAPVQAELRGLKSAIEPGCARFAHGGLYLKPCLGTEHSGYLN